MGEGFMRKFAILLRLNPQNWPIWDTELNEDSYTNVWFTTGRRIPSDITPDLPVVVLGTDGLGVVAWGKTSTYVEFRPDPDWQQSPPEHQPDLQAPENRVCVKIKRVQIPFHLVQATSSIANLHRTARETTTWLTEEQFGDFSDLLQRTS
jgi:hypothetical protein